MTDYTKSPGAVWEKEGKQGKWLSISLDVDTMNNLVNLTQGENIRLVAFLNKNKKKDSSPDYWIQAPREERERKEPGEDGGVPF